MCAVWMHGYRIPSCGCIVDFILCQGCVVCLHDILYHLLPLSEYPHGVTRLCVFLLLFKLCSCVVEHHDSESGSDALAVCSRCTTEYASWTIPLCNSHCISRVPCSRRPATHHIYCTATPLPAASRSLRLHFIPTPRLSLDSSSLIVEFTRCVASLVHWVFGTRCGAMEEVEEIESGDGDCGTTMGVRDEVEEMEEMPIPTLKRITTRPTDRPKGMTTVTVDGLEGYRRHRSRKLLRRVGVRILVALLGAVMVIGKSMSSSLPLTRAP